MKILLINQTFYPDAASTAQHLTDFSEDLAKAGHEVTVLTARRSYDNPAKILPGYEKKDGVEIIRVWQTGFGKKKRLGRILDALTLNVAFAWELLWLKKYDKVMAMTSPPLVGLIAAAHVQVRKSELICWMMDIQPDEAVAAGWMKKGSLWARLLEQILRYVLSESRQIIVLDDFMKDRILSKGAGLEKKIEVIPPWAHDRDLETIRHDQNPFRRKHGLAGKFIVMYSGNHSICHPLDTLLNAALSFKNDPKIAFVFIGGGERVKEVLNFKRTHKIDNILYSPYQDRSELKNSLSAADVHMVVMGEPFVGIVHPCKIYAVLKIGRPFIYVGPEKSSIGQIMKISECGYRVDHGESDKLALTIEKIRSLNREELEKIMIQEQQIAPKYSKAVLGKKMRDCILREVSESAIF
jgi:glycosyltransferase involved in cell wall biosynthesis